MTDETRAVFELRGNTTAFPLLRGQMACRVLTSLYTSGRMYRINTRKKEEVIVEHTKFSREYGSHNMGMGLATLQMIKPA